MGEWMSHGESAVYSAECVDAELLEPSDMKLDIEPLAVLCPLHPVYRPIITPPPAVFAATATATNTTGAGAGTGTGAAAAAAAADSFIHPFV